MVDNLKDVSYAIDDVLDEWSTAIVRAQTEEDDFSHSWFESQLLQFPFLRQVCSFLPINSCFACTEFGNRYEIARKIKKLNARLDDIAKERKREQDKTAIKKMLMVESGNRSNLQLQVVSIAGIGGLGKTTLAKLVYNDKDVEKYFENRVWVSVSKPFDEVKIAKSILEILTDAASFFNEFETIMQHIQKLVKGKRFLLVLDDVWEDGPSKWERMRDSFTSASLGSSILVTTRDMSVPGNMGCRRDCLFKLGKLSLEDCWSIFSEIAFFQKNNEERGRLEAIGREIVEKCDGLPMAAKTLACLLRSKQSWKEWQSVLDSEVWELDGLWEKGSETQSGFASLWLSYYNMVSELRPCFSYCSIFPKDHEIKKDVLIQLWMAQGYLRQTPAEDMERIGEKYFQNLAAFSFFEELKKDDYGNIISCKMYNIVHDFAKYIRKNECLSIEVDGGEELRTDSLGKEVRHLRVMLGKEVSFPSSIYRLKNLRSLWVQSKGNSMIGAALPNLFRIDLFENLKPEQL
ncbi:hypothetical protein GH714_020074 [Hevea brasiliensis]|uniref:Uncharacterized protein n=1 Tax=Hevea brasiliensis TaxID=3981 RepID=A0A6A6LI21_HEVBR|nr:hypothetical protein GH714_020074 [Hevea brasiliensis]